MKNKLLGYIFIFAIFAATVSTIYYLLVSSSVPDGFFPSFHQAQKSQTYKNTQYGFQFSYAKAYELDPSGSQANFFKNEAKSLVSVSVPQSLYPKTNFGSANLGVAVQQKSVESSCLKASETEEINGTLFHRSEVDGAAAGTHYQTKIYRVFRNPDCFEVSLTVGIANIGNFEPGAVLEVDENDIWNKLDQLLKTFKFTDSNPSATPAPIPAPAPTPTPTPSPSPTSGANGTLTGHVTIGPNCPVEMLRSQGCLPPPGAFSSTRIVVYKPDGRTVVASQTPRPESANSEFAVYSFSLPPGNYQVDYERTGDFMTTHTLKPATIESGKTTTVDFDIDTGIR